MSKEIISPDDNHGFADIIDRYGWDDTTKRAYAVSAMVRPTSAPHEFLSPSSAMALLHLI